MNQDLVILGQDLLILGQDLVVLGQDLVILVQGLFNIFALQIGQLLLCVIHFFIPIENL